VFILVCVLCSSPLDGFPPPPLWLSRYASRHPDVVELLMEWGVAAERALAAAERWAPMHGTLPDT